MTLEIGDMMRDSVSGQTLMWEGSYWEPLPEPPLKGMMVRRVEHAAFGMPETLGWYFGVELKGKPANEVVQLFNNFTKEELEYVAEKLLIEMEKRK